MCLSVTTLSSAHKVLTSPSIDRDYAGCPGYRKSGSHHSGRDDKDARTEEERNADLPQLRDPQLPEDRHRDGHNEAIGEDVQDHEDPEVLGTKSAAVAG